MSLRTGSVVKLGHYYQHSFEKKTPVEWIVVEKEGNHVKLISKYVLRNLPFNDCDVRCSWENSKIREYLNHQFFYELFNATERRVIVEQENITDDDEDDDGLESVKTLDKMYLMSAGEYNNARNIIDYGFQTLVALKESPFFRSREDLTTENYCYWWLRTSGVTLDTKLLAPHYIKHRYNYIEGIRPMITINTDLYESMKITDSEDNVECVVNVSSAEVNEGIYTGSDITEAVISERTKLIHNYAFAGCHRLEKVIIKNTKCHIEPRAFSECERANIMFDFNDEQKNLLSSFSSEKRDLAEKITEALSELRMSPEETWVDDGRLVFIINKTLVFTDIKITGKDCRDADDILVKLFGLGKVSGKLAYLDRISGYKSAFMSNGKLGTNEDMNSYGVKVSFKDGVELEYEKPCTIGELYPAILQMLDGKIRVDEYMIQIHEKSIATTFECYKNESVEKAIPPYLAKEDALEAYCWNRPYELVIRFVVREGVLDK